MYLRAYETVRGNVGGEGGRSKTQRHGYVARGGIEVEDGVGVEHLTVRKTDTVRVGRRLDTGPFPSPAMSLTYPSPGAWRFAFEHRTTTTTNQPGDRAHDARAGERRAQAGGEACPGKPRLSRSLPKGRAPLLLVA